MKNKRMSHTGRHQRLLCQFQHLLQDVNFDSQQKMNFDSHLFNMFHTSYITSLFKYLHITLK